MLVLAVSTARIQRRCVLHADHTRAKSIVERAAQVGYLFRRRLVSGPLILRLRVDHALRVRLG